MDEMNAVLSLAANMVIGECRVIADPWCAMPLILVTASS
jgi:hypothetical protein